PIAYFISWTTYGTWLHGDKRGWVERNEPGIQPGDLARHDMVYANLAESPVVLDEQQRMVAAEIIRAHCAFRKWHLHAVNPRSNHIHAVVTAPVAPEDVMQQLKAWSTRRLNELNVVRKAARRK